MQLSATNPATNQQAVVAQAASSYVFSARISSNADWAVSVLSAPVGQLCRVNPASGTVVGADVSNAALSCTTVSVALSPSTLPNTAFNTAYSQTLSASSANGGAGPYTFRVSAGALPPGLALSSAGVLSGTPIAAGAFNFTVNATSGNGFIGAQAYTLVIARAAQVITNFVATPATPVFSESGNFSVSATGGLSGLPVTFGVAPASAAVCSSGGANGATISMLAAGTCAIRADQAGNANYAAATQAQQNFVVGKAPQTITFTSTIPTNAKVGGTYASAVSGGKSTSAVELTIDASTATHCTISGNVISFVAKGACLINANQKGDANYADATQAQQTVSIDQAGTVVAVASSLNPSKPGDEVAFTVNVGVDPAKRARASGVTKAAPVPTGTVTVSNKGTELGATALDVSGQAVVRTKALTTVGDHVLVISYSGDANNAAATSSFTQTVVAAPVIAPTPVPATSSGALMLLSVALAGCVALGLRRASIG
ncbi:Ig-like domain repeat protein [Diaphorobacter aerolatus]|uniref:Ig-like domain repeat protein n=1 Tax=Diaphorobacter aerolatus TaxID=1288495 RepID=A0A7H0GI16_9BURK|nr:Ig-like domain repeat protein [Diaphorobacter aerolatus]